jgi:predicted hotdog family 3-hydroxylacyl-ACP dehydratase
MLPKTDDILSLIPQREPMVMISRLIDANESCATTEFDIQPDNIFVVENQLTEPGIIENMAQTAAVQAGYYFSLNNIPVPIGYIAMVKNLEITNLPLINTHITTTINIRSRVLDITMVDAVVKIGNEEVAKCEMRIFIKK